MLSLRKMIKGVLRFPADALIESSRSFSGRVDECLRHSPVLAEAIQARLNEAQGGQSDSATAWQDPFVREATEHLEQAGRLGMDVNDYLEQQLGWNVRPLLERALVPRLHAHSVVCELGPGTGRWSRRILEEIAQGELHLVDYSPWFVEFLTEYFRNEPRVRVHKTQGDSIPIAGASIDLMVSFGTFIMLQLGTIYRYAREFRRVLKPGCYFVVEYIDINTPEGWELFETSCRAGDGGCYTYHTPEVLARVFRAAGLEVIEDDHVAQWCPGYQYRFLTGRRST